MRILKERESHSVCVCVCVCVCVVPGPFFWLIVNVLRVRTSWLRWTKAFTIRGIRSPTIKSRVQPYGTSSPDSTWCICHCQYLLLRLSRQRSHADRNQADGTRPQKEQRLLSEQPPLHPSITSAAIDIDRSHRARVPYGFNDNRCKYSFNPPRPPVTRQRP